MRRTGTWIFGIGLGIALPFATAVHLVPDRFGGLRMVSADTVEETVDLFKEAGFDPLAVSDRTKGEVAVPRVFLAGLPQDIEGTKDIDNRKSLFVSVVLPHILHANERLREDRVRILALREQHRTERRLRKRDLRWLETVAVRYGTETLDFEELLRRVDVIPPRLALAQAAQESGWGTSRFARLGNALFGQHAPDGENAMAAREAPGVSLRAFESLQHSVLGYMRNLNTHRAYKRFRFARERMRNERRTLDAVELADTLGNYSEEGRIYVKRLRAVMALPEVAAAREARLTEERG
jgi:Bax protein